MLKHEQIMEQNMRKSGYTDADISQALSSWEVTKTLLPREFDDIAKADTCYFCKGEKKNKKDLYTDVYFAHEQPLTMKSSILSFGQKNIQAKIGSLVKVNLPICKSCKRTISMLEKIKWFFLIGFLAIAFVVIGLIDFSDSQNYLIPYIILIVSGIVGYFVGKLAASIAYNKNKDKVQLDIFEIDVISKMKEKGWFTLQDEKQSMSMNFVKKPEEFGKVFDD